MENVKLEIYLFFEGNCREAMEFYKNIFGGELTVQTYDEVPGDTADEKKGLIIHAKLEGGEVTLMASDTTEKKLGRGKIELSLTGADESKLRSHFEKLSEGGTVKYQLTKEFWGDIFGTLTDKFGVDWMVNISMPKE